MSHAGYRADPCVYVAKGLFSRQQVAANPNERGNTGSEYACSPDLPGRMFPSANTLEQQPNVNLEICRNFLKK